VISQIWEATTAKRDQYCPR